MLLKVEQIFQNERIEVGRLGENDANIISFDFAEWVESYGDGNIALLFQRPTEALIYPIALSVNGTVATWTVSETDTAISGKAHATLIYTVDEVIKKSAEFFCMVEKVLSANGQPPEPYEDYLAQIVAAGAAAEEAAGIAEGYAGSAEGYAADAKDYADAAKDSKDDAAGAAAGAYQSATDAEAAKDAILNMTATAEGLPAGSTPTVTKTEIGGIFNLAFGIPAGEKGAQGDPGTPGATGAPGQDGAPGQRGSIWFSGSGPSPDLPEVPQDGDLYLCTGVDADYPRGNVYQYISGSWDFVVNLVGDAIDDRYLVPMLIGSIGAKDAFHTFAMLNSGETLNALTARFFTAAAETSNKVYSTQFYKFDTNPTSDGTKLADNAGLVCTPSTNTTAGQDDYKNLPLFMCFDCNYTIDPDTLEPVIHAIKDVAGAFSSAPSNSFVGVLQMTGWVRRTTTATTKTVEYRSTRASGFVPLPEGVRASDNSVRPFVIHAKYAAGLDANGKLSSISGVQPATSRSGSAGSKSISHDGQISLWRAWGDQYGGSGLCDIAFVQLMLEIKYAVLGSAQIMQGCRDYSTSYKAAVSESAVTRIILTAANAAYFIVGSSVSLGSSSDRGNSNCYNTCDIVKIASKEVVEVEGTEYTAINLDTTTAFSTTAGGTYITPHPWRTGSTDAVLGNDGSLTSNSSQKEPFKLQGIELMIGVYEVPGDTTCQETATSGDVPGVYKVYTNRLAANIRSGDSGVDPVQVGTITKSGSTAGWKYVAELNWEANDQEAYMLCKQFGGTASSSNGYRAALQPDSEGTAGWREWRAFGCLNNVGNAGFACTHLLYTLSNANWSIGARACGTGGNRGVYSE